MRDSFALWTGRAGSYDRVRPPAPPVLLDLLTQSIAMPRPSLVVDLGSGTGLSTAIWAERADRVIGIEPNADMRSAAMGKVEGHPSAAPIEYRDGLAQQTGLPDACADIVTAAQSFHWMEPTSTLAEVARILRPGGLFAAYDYDTPPAIHWELDWLAGQVTRRSVALLQERGIAPSGLKIWPRNKSLAPLRESAEFRFTREVFLHSIEQGDAARYLALMQTSALYNPSQFTDEEVGFDSLQQAAFQFIGSEPIPWYISYRVRIGVK